MTISDLNPTGAPPPVLTPLSPDKATTEGQWKRKKGPAPPRPIPQKRQVKKLPRKAVNTELHDIEVSVVLRNKKSKFVQFLEYTRWSISSDSWFGLGYTILLSCSASSANFPSAQAEPSRGWNIQNQSQPNPSPQADMTPCTEK